MKGDFAGTRSLDCCLRRNDNRPLQSAKVLQFLGFVRRRGLTSPLFPIFQREKF
jgi:hypothetical protein